MSDVTITDNTPLFEGTLEQAKRRALENIGGRAEMYARGLAPVDTGALRNSITHAVEGNTVVIGSKVDYAPYVELGTGPNYEPPPEWIESNAEGGRHMADQRARARPFLRPAMRDHRGEYESILMNALTNG